MYTKRQTIPVPAHIITLIQSPEPLLVSLLAYASAESQIGLVGLMEMKVDQRGFTYQWLCLVSTI